MRVELARDAQIPWTVREAAQAVLVPLTAAGRVPDETAAAIALASLAEAYRIAGKTASAVDLFEKVKGVYIANLGPDHRRTLTILHNLAQAYLDAGKKLEAIALLEQGRDARVKKQGADHPETLVSMTSLGEVYRLAGQPGIKLLEQVERLCGRSQEYAAAYSHPGGHRTSNMLDRVMRGMNRYFDRGQHLHG